MSETTKVRVSREWWWDGWNHGKYVDFWTAQHFLAGIVWTFVGIFFDIPWTPLVLLLTGIFILWEIFEWIMKVAEPFTNHVTDIVSSLVGLILSWYIFALSPEPFVRSLFTALVVLYGGLALWGHLAWRRKRGLLGK